MIKNIKGFDQGVPVAHPSTLIETASLSAIHSPESEFPLAASLAPIVNEGLLSDAQLESVLSACETHSWRIRGNELYRAGYAIGDGAGVGKGRQVAALIIDSWVRGRKRVRTQISFSDTRTPRMILLLLLI